MKRNEWRKFIDYFGLSIEADPYRMGKKYVHFGRIGSITITSSGNPYLVRQHLDKWFSSEPPKLRLYQLTKNIAAKIAPHIFSALRDLGVIFDKFIIPRSPTLACADCTGTEDSCCGAKNEQ